ncbi:MAG: metallophosphoesterase family protein [Bacteroidales bacterium]
MPLIGLLSDTHGSMHTSIPGFFSECDEIWHAGDIGNLATAEALQKLKPLRAVHGNIDGQELRLLYPAQLRFTIDGVSVFMIHIGGYPGRYEKQVREILALERPRLFISGHSHILKVINDERFGLLHINPGAAGNSGMHQVITAMRFKIDQGKISDLDILEIKRG